MNEGVEKAGAQTIYDDFWKEIIEVDGEIKMQKLQAELADFYHLITNVSKVYMHVTSGRISKPLTDPDVVMGLSDEYYGGLLPDPDLYSDFLEYEREFKDWLKSVK